MRHRCCNCGHFHDIVEDTENVTTLEVREKFGKKVADFVEALTFDEGIGDYVEKYKENFARCKGLGYEALIIRVADFLDNIEYYFAPLNLKVFNKLRYFVNEFEDTLKDDISFRELIRKYRSLQKTYRYF